MPPGHGTPWVKTKELDDRWLVETEEWISERALAESSAKVLPSNTVLMAMYGATVGKLGLLASPMACNQASCAMIVDPQEADYRYLFYRLLHERPRLVGLANGAAQQNLSAATIKKFSFPTPPLAEQRRIAEVLGAIDDLIDTNDTLVSRLRALQAGAVLQLSQTATRFVSLGTIAAIRRDKAVGGGDTPYLGLEHFAERGRGISAIGRLRDVGEGQQSFRKGDLLYGRLRPYFQKVDRAGFDGACTGEIWVMKPTGAIPLTWLAGIVSAPEFTDFAMAGSDGTKMPRAKWDHVARYQVPFPDQEELERLDAGLDGMWEQIWALQQENEQLRRTRDELLPLLMGGAVRMRPAGGAA